MVDSRGARTQDGRRAERLELRVPTTPTQLPAVRAMAGDHVGAGGGLVFQKVADVVQ